MEHPETDLDDLITPLWAAAFLGRYEIVEMLLENPMLDIDLQTEDTGLTPLWAASANGHYLIVKTLVENGADVNKTTALHSKGQRGTITSSSLQNGPSNGKVGSIPEFSPLYYWFTRMTEKTNLFENKNICCKMAEVLLEAGANIDFMTNGKTLLMRFWGIAYDMNKVQEQMNLEVIQFLLQHGANKELRT